jgi:hypothetical protein
LAISDLTSTVARTFQSCNDIHSYFASKNEKSRDYIATVGGTSYASVNVRFLDLWRQVKCGVMWNALSCNIAERGLITVNWQRRAA